MFKKKPKPFPLDIDIIEAGSLAKELVNNKLLNTFFENEKYEAFQAWSSSNPSEIDNRESYYLSYKLIEKMEDGLKKLIELALYEAKINNK